MAPPVLWIDDGRRFSFDDIVLWQGRGRQAFAEVARDIDTIILGPHASAHFPGELRAFVSPELTLRKQCDFSDLLTSDLGRAWAAADRHAVFIENPVSRLVLDANRAPPADTLAGLREFYRRLAQQRAGESVGFGGVDAVRPITFGGEAVLLEPTSAAQWEALGRALAAAAERTVAVYRASCDSVLQAVLECRPAGAPLHVFSLHDTMNTRMRSDGAIVLARPQTDRLPRLANLGNRGDAQGEEQNEPLTIAGAELRRIAAGWVEAFGLQGSARASDILLNRPYKGAFETVHYGARLRSLAAQRTGAVQVEFLRETLLGPAAIAQLHAPGDDWPEADAAHIGAIAASLAHAGRLLRAD